MKLRSSVYGWRSVWMEFAEEKAGDVVDEQKAFTMRVPAKEKPWTVTFTMNPRGTGASASDFTTVALPYKAKGAFSFAIFNRNWIQEAGKVFGVQDIEVGDADFDRDYIIKGSDEKAVKRLFGNERLKELIRMQKSVHLSIHDEPAELKPYGTVPPGVNILAFRDNEAINSFERLGEIHELMVVCLDQLVEIDRASNSDPHFEV